MKCPYCRSSNTFTYIEIQNMPNILSACPLETISEVKMCPFEVKLCKDCLLGFNSTQLEIGELNFIYDNYLYISPLNGIGSTKYEDMLNLAREYCSKNERIVEIGCSDGYLLKSLKDQGYRNLTGIEPGPQADTAQSLGLNVIKGYFNKDVFFDNSVECFIMMHVFEHFLDPFSIIESMKKQLSLNGKMIIEVPYFTGYHHQHLFFYNLTFLKRLCSEKGLRIVGININESHNTLGVVVVHLENASYKEAQISENPVDIIKLSSTQLEKFKEKVNKINTLLQGKEKVYCWGAGSLSVIFLNQIDKDILKNTEIVVVDGDKNKWGLHIPGLNFVVQPFTILNAKTIENLIIASSHFKEIQNTINENNISVGSIEVLY